MEDRSDVTNRLEVEVFVGPEEGSTIAEDVRRGLAEKPRFIHPKHFYDARGAELFDAICDTPEYYVTRTEQALLDTVVDDIVAETRPTDLVELGSGAARKTRTLLEAILRKGKARYVPFDVSEEMLRKSALELLADYPELVVHGLVADYERHLDRLPRNGRRLIAFLGSTIGNFEPAHAVRFLGTLAESMKEEDRLLLGLDLVKPVEVLNAAYNDEAGVTAAFNLNVLSVINAKLGADFRLSDFEHVAYYEPKHAQVEMYLRARRPVRVRIADLDMTIELEEGEKILTEVSRKHTREGAEAMLARAGLAIERWDESPDGGFALALLSGHPRAPR